MELKNNIVEFADNIDLSANSFLYSLVIGIFDSELVYFIVDKDNNKIIAFKTFNNTINFDGKTPIISSFIELFNKPPFNYKYHRVYIAINGQVQLIPQEVYDENMHNKLYYQFAEPNPECIVLSNQLRSIQANVLFSMPSVDYKFISDLYQNGQILNSATLYIDSILATNKNASPNLKICVNAQQYSVDIVILNNNSLQFFNSFKIASTEDIIYYLQFIEDHLELDLSKSNVVLSGVISKDSHTFNLIKSYVYTIQLVEVRSKFLNQSFINPELFAKYFSLFNYFLCEL